MKISDITEGFWDYMRGYMDPHNKMSSFSRLLSRRDREGVSDKEWYDNLLKLGSDAETGTTPEEYWKILPWKRQQIDQLRQQNKMSPVDWNALDAKYSAKSAPVPKSATPSSSNSAVNQYGAMTAQASPKPKSSNTSMSGKATAAWSGSGQQPYSATINNVSTAQPAKKTKPRRSVRADTGPAPSSPTTPDVDAMTPTERRKYYTDLFKSGTKVSARRS